MKLFFFLLLTFTLFKPVFSQKQTLSKGKWIINLIPNDTVVIPFYLNVEINQSGKYQFSILNGEESIQIVNHQFKNDSLFIELLSTESGIIMQKVINTKYPFLEISLIKIVLI
jgi:hypothetical protein